MLLLSTAWAIGEAGGLEEDPGMEGIEVDLVRGNWKALCG